MSAFRAIFRQQGEIVWSGPVKWIDQVNSRTVIVPAEPIETDAFRREQHSHYCIENTDYTRLTITDETSPEDGRKIEADVTERIDGGSG